MAEHEKGSMDISHHEATYTGFMKLTTWFTGLTVVVVLLLMFIFG